jgi:uncharacterized SAM-dependent methyltransferase
MLPISVLLSEEEILRGLVEDLRARRIPEKYFYWSPQSASAWLALCRSEAYLNYRRSLGLLVERSAALLESFGRRPAEVVSLGAGDGSKEIPILEALAARGARPPYVAVDVSQWLLEAALARAAAAGSRVHGIKADLTRPEHLRAIDEERTRSPRLYTLLGNTVGALDHAAFLPILAGLLHEDDRLIVDGEIFIPEATRSGYLNPDNRRFATAPLRSLGISEEDGEVVFDLVEEDDPEGLRRLRKHFLASRAVDLVAGDERIPIARGERLDMGFSCKYGRETFREVLRRFGGLVVEREFVSSDGGFVLAVARRDAR